VCFDSENFFAAGDLRSLHGKRAASETSLSPGQFIATARARCRRDASRHSQRYSQSFPSRELTPAAFLGAGGP
jgi:hypothetical protein